MTIEEFFNPYSIEHMKAYDELCKNGRWPENFIIPDEIEFTGAWPYALTAKISKAWLEAIKNNHIFGMPPFE